MTQADRTFPWLVLASLAAHAALMGLLSLASGGSGPRNRVQIYSVQIIEAPAPPEARVLALEPPVSHTSLGVPLAPPGLSQLRTPTPPLPAAPGRGEALPIPVPPRTEGDTQASLKAPPAGLPPPPQRPDAAKSESSQTPHPGSAPAARSLPPDTGAGETRRARPMERLRSKVEQIKLQVEPSPKAESGAEDQRSALDLRLFHNAVRERVQKNYSFPGSFAPNLKARVRVVVGRDGNQRAVDLLESSGDSRFDTLVCMAAIRNSRLPPVPDSVDGDTVTLTLTCSP